MSHTVDAEQEQRIKSFDKLLIGGRWVTPSSDRKIDVISPTTEERIAQVPEAMEADMDAAVAAARKAFTEGPWPRMSPTERAAVIARFAAIHRAQADEKATIVPSTSGRTTRTCSRRTPSTRSARRVTRRCSSCTSPSAWSPRSCPGTDL